MALTPDEDEGLRRLHVLAQFGEFPELMQSRYRELRERDERIEIREPTLDVQWLPIQRSRDDALDDVDASELADMTAFESSLRDQDPYIVPPVISGFVPFRAYGTG